MKNLKPTLFDAILSGDKETAQKLLKSMGDHLPPKYRRNYTMAHEPTEGRGIFGPNTYKKTPNAPDWKGQIMHNGEIIKISGWLKKSSFGEFLSLAVDRPPNQAPAQQYPKEVNTFDDSDIPF